jgi:hypothetical protein
MTPEEFQQRIHEMRDQFGDLFDRYGLVLGERGLKGFNAVGR